MPGRGNVARAREAGANYATSLGDGTAEQTAWEAGRAYAGEPRP